MNALILSSALDTNGQNARFARAAERWGDDPTVLKVLAIGNADPAGVVGRFATAAEHIGGLRIRAAHRATAYFDFPTDIVWDRSTDRLVAELVDAADVVHLNNSHRAAQRFRIAKPMLLHHHGSLFRSAPDKMLAVARQYKMLQAVSTLDLTRPAPELLTWLPSAYDVVELTRFGEQNGRPPDGRVRIVSCPTNRQLKATDLLIAAVDELRAEGLPVDLVLVEGRTWSESLTEKARADIVFDQLAYGYGCNGIEAWSLGRPVVAGADRWTLDRMRREFGRLPFYQATSSSLVDRLRKVVTSSTLRAELAGRGSEHVMRYHDERPALARLAELYTAAIRHYSAQRIAGKGSGSFVTFSNPQGRRLWVDDELLTFGPDACLTTNDPYVIARLRSIATRRPLWGVVELDQAGG